MSVNSDGNFNAPSGYALQKSVPFLTIVQSAKTTRALTQQQTETKNAQYGTKKANPLLTPETATSPQTPLKHPDAVLRQQLGTAMPQASKAQATIPLSQRNKPPFPPPKKTNPTNPTTSRRRNPHKPFPKPQMGN